MVYGLWFASPLTFMLVLSTKEEIRYMKGEMDEHESGEALVAGTRAAAQAIEDIPTQSRH